MSLWYAIGGLGFVLFLYFIDALVSTSSIKRIADAAETRNLIEEQKVKELVSINNWRRLESQMRIEKLELKMPKNGKEGATTVQA